MEKDLLKNYVEAVLKFQQEKQNTRWSLAELENISNNLGLSQEDLTQIEEYFKASLDRGTGFLYYNNLEKAIPELEMAVTLKPLHAEALFATAQAYAKRWQKNHAKKDLDNALQYAERVLQSDARHQNAIKLISEITKKNQKRNQKIKTFLVIVSVVGFAIVISVFLWWFFKENTEEKQEKQQKNIVEKKDIYIYDNQGEIPLELIISPAKEKIIDVEVYNSFWRKNNETKDYYAKFIIKSKTLELQSFEAKLQLFDENNQKIKEEEWNLENQFRYEIRPNDEFPLEKTIKNIPENIKNATLIITKIKSNKPEKYENSKEISLEWENQNLKTRHLKIKERHQLIEIDADGFYHSLQFEIDNQMKKNINYLKLKIVWFNIDEQPIFETEIEPILSEQPPQKNGAIRTIEKKFWVAHKRNEYEKYKIIVIEIR
ncbi:MAG: tetratricopeptide repeat protein [Bacteroidetes bacterium]|nr:MAG: tetratricopeptide repeat protein [Bacteroidota bacterium]TAG85613.1 MAG: tetratricopeptide repeat protein [Bacteroidota bacterium]